MEYNRLLDLLSRKLLDKELTEAEAEELNLWLEDPRSKAFYEEELSRGQVFKSVGQLSDLNEKRMDEKMAILMGRKAGTGRLRAIAPYLRVAAILILIAGSAIILWRLRAIKKITNNSQAVAVHDLPPGGNRAVLTLANGQKVSLDSAGNGIIAKQGMSLVKKVGDGELTYQGGSSAGPAGYNTLVTPRGGQYRIVLPDGTVVWLNAASSIRFPTAFTGTSREVEITGEAYFEVKHSITMPFRVQTRGQVIEDIGTHFNVNAYEDESIIKTTLLEGSVKEGPIILSHPGEQAGVSKDGKVSLVKNVNLDDIISWKNGYFEFTDTDIKAVMRQVARWYGVTIVYGNDNDTALFTGQFGRNLTASQVFQVLSATGYRFSIKDKTILVE